MLRRGVVFLNERTHSPQYLEFCAQESTIPYIHTVCMYVQYVGFKDFPVSCTELVYIHTYIQRTKVCTFVCTTVLLKLLLAHIV